MSNNNFDVTVVGGGPGGYHAAIRSAQLGLQVALVEKDNGTGLAGLGGVCLNWGCIPSKSLLKNAELVNQIKESEKWGISFEKVDFNFGKAISRSRDVSNQLTQGIGYLIKKNKIHLFEDKAKISGPKEIMLEKSRDIIASENIILATGARPRSLPNLEINKSQIITSREALELSSLPKSIGIVGAGAIGVEFAYLFNAYGVDVTLFEALDHLVPNEDESISKELEKIFLDKGIKFELNAKVTKTTVNSSQINLEYNVNGQTKEFSSEKLLVAVGVQANTDDIGLEELGIEMDRGFIKINDSMQTSVPSIYAVGDVIDKGPMLAHKAEDEGIAVAEIIAGQAGRVNYDAIPAVIYTSPEVAMVGKTEEQLKKENVKYRVGKFPFLANSRAKVNNETEGFVKIIADEKTDKVLGVSMISAVAGTMIAELAIAMEFGASAEDIARTCHAHPTHSEAVKEAAMAVDKRPIHF